MSSSPSPSSPPPLMRLESFGACGAIVWDAKDALRLRRQFRVVGSLVGCLPRAASQVQWSGLPLLLSPEEVNLLVAEEKVARLVKFGSHKEASAEAYRAHKQFRENSYHEQIQAARESRKRKILSMIDQIVEGKIKRKAKAEKSAQNKDKGTDVAEDAVAEDYEEDSEREDAKDEEADVMKEKLVEDMFGSIPDLPRSQALVQTFLGPPPWSEEEVLSEVPWPPTGDDLPENFSARCRVYVDLWRRGFTLTTGAKFGADLLAYPGDPVKYHAQLVVTCIDCSEGGKSEDKSSKRDLDLVARCRLSTAVKKTGTLAKVLKEGTVEYERLVRADSEQKTTDVELAKDS